MAVSPPHLLYLSCHSQLVPRVARAFAFHHPNCLIKEMAIGRLERGRERRALSDFSSCLLCFSQSSHSHNRSLRFLSSLFSHQNMLIIHTIRKVYFRIWID